MKAPLQYHFRFERVVAELEHLPQFSLTQTSLKSTIHVSGSEKTVSDILVNDVPTDTFDPGVLLTIDEIFDVLEESVNRQAGEVLFTYDPDLGFPAWVHIHDYSDIVEEIVEYQVTDFQAD